MASQGQLLAALHALYHNDDQAVKDEADRWLENWQQSVEAWSVADTVLHDSASSMEAQYFCALTLRTKVSALLVSFLLCLLSLASPAVSIPCPHIHTLSSIFCLPCASARLRPVVLACPAG